MEFSNGMAEGPWDYVELTAALLEGEGKRLRTVIGQPGWQCGS
jgi:hypothetical protein